MNWLKIGIGFVVTAFMVNFVLDFFGVSNYVYRPYTAIFGAKA
jgi:hypothetical protein